MTVLPGLIYIQNVFSLIFLDTNYLEVVNNICVNSCVTNKNAQRHGTRLEFCRNSTKWRDLGLHIEFFMKR